MRILTNLLRLTILGMLSFVIINLGLFQYHINSTFLSKKAQMVRVHDQQKTVSNALAEASDWRKTALYYQEQLAKASAVNEQLSTDQSIARYELNTFLRVLQSTDYEAYLAVMEILKGAR